jgi:hypothetical protein
MQQKDFLTRLLSSRYLVLSGLFFMVVDRLFNYVFHGIQLKWEPRFQQSSHLGYWWLITAGFEFAKWAFVIAVLLVLFRKHLRMLMQSPAISVFIDYFMVVILWALSAIFSNPLLKSYLNEVGLAYLSNVLFWGGALWFLIAFLRLKIIFVGKSLSSPS